MSWIRQTSFLLVFFFPSLVISDSSQQCYQCHLPNGVFKKIFHKKPHPYILKFLKDLRDNERDSVMHLHLENFDDQTLYSLSKELEETYKK